MLISVIICTADRPSSLADTLQSLAGVSAPEGWQWETLVIDNGSTGTTAAVAQRQPSALNTRYAREPRRGQAFARNHALTLADGDILVFIDDDVRPQPGWLSRLCAPLLAERAEAATGAITLPPHLSRPWLTPDHLECLAIRDGSAKPRQGASLTGANMAFLRRVLSRVPWFDPALGPGALGFYDDTLFSYQLSRAGFRVVFEASAAVEHHFDPERLGKRQLIDAAYRAGQSAGYLAHHWRHQVLRFARARLQRIRLVRALLGGGYGANRARPSAAQLRWSWSEGFFSGYLKEVTQPRRYEREGLVRLDRHL